MKLSLIFVIIISFSLCNASGLLLPWSAQNAATENSILLTSSVANFSVNPAIFHSGFEMTYCRLYEMSELPRYQASSAFKIKNINLGLAISDLDHPNYNEFCSLLNISYDFKYIKAGLNYKYYHTSITGKGSRSSSSSDFGLQYSFGDFTSSFSSLNAISINSNDIDLPEYFIMETAYSIEDQINLTIKIEKETEQEFHPTLATGIQVHQAINLLVSYSENPQITGLGMAIDCFGWQVSYGVQIHPKLSLSHYISLKYEKIPGITPASGL